MRKIKEVIIHCTATPDGEPCPMETIRRWHVARGFRREGYHFAIQPDGLLEYGRPINMPGAHVRGRNQHSIGIALAGGEGSHRQNAFFAHYSAAQQHRLIELIGSLATVLPEPFKLRAHNEFANKACPGFDLAEWANRVGYGALLP